MLAILAETVPEGRLFALDSQTVISIIIQLLNAAILAVALTFILYKPVKKFLGNRAEKIQNRIDTADQTMARATALITEYDQKIKDIGVERAGILEAAQLEADAEKKSILEEAKKEARKIKERSLESIAEDKKRLGEETRLHIIELSYDMAKKYLKQNMDDQTQSKLFEEAMSQLEDSKWQG